MDYNKMLFAAEVRKLAHQMLDTDVKVALSQFEDDPAGLEEWGRTNTFEAYLERAYNDLVRVSALIDSYGKD